jgi:hypothetical protein
MKITLKQLVQNAKDIRDGKIKVSNMVHFSEAEGQDIDRVSMNNKKLEKILKQFGK